MATKKVPDFLKKGALVKVQFWVGEVEDVCVSEERIMVLVASPKGIWRNHPAEWLEYQDGQIMPATTEEAVENLQQYRERIADMLQALDAMVLRWRRN